MLFNFKCITETIVQIEKSSATLKKTLALVQNVDNKLRYEGGLGIEFTKIKLTQILSKNSGYSQIKKIF